MNATENIIYLLEIITSPGSVVTVKACIPFSYGTVTIFVFVQFVYHS